MLRQEIQPTSDRDNRVRPGFLPVAFSAPISRTMRDLIEEVQGEMTKKALDEESGCFYFSPHAGTFYDKSLEAVRKFSRQIMLNERLKGFKFSFLKLALTAQPPLNELHIDANARNAIGSPDAVWQGGTNSRRAILNLHHAARVLQYSSQDPNSVPIKNQNGLWVPESYDPELIQSATTPPIEDRVIHGQEFNAGGIMHRASDGLDGCFVAAYGRQDYVWLETDLIG